MVREARDQGQRKIKRLLPVQCSGSSAQLRPPTAVMSKGPIKIRSITQTLSSFCPPETTTTVQNTGKTARAKSPSVM